MEENRQVQRERTATGDVVTEKTTTGPAPAEQQAAEKEKNVFQAYYLVYYLMGFLEIVLAFRLVFKLLGANPSGGFVSLLYSVSGVFLAPFFGIFHASTSQGAETTSVFEPAILIAMVVYAILGWGIAKLFDIFLAKKDSTV